MSSDHCSPVILDIYVFIFFLFECFIFYYALYTGPSLVIWMGILIYLYLTQGSVQNIIHVSYNLTIKIKNGSFIVRKRLLDFVL